MVKKTISELLGTFLLVFFGVGAAIITQAGPTNYQGLVITALIFGGVLTALISTIGEISGGHFNPAVSIAMMIDKRINFIDLIMYVLAQFVGATCATFVLKLMVSYSSTLGSNTLYDGDTLKTFFIEAMMTFLFVFVVLTASDKKHESKNTPFIIGGTLGMLHLFGILFDGAGLNPARSFASMAMYSWSALVDYLPFLSGPVFGSIIAWLVYFGLMEEHKVAQKKPKKEKKKKQKVIEEVLEEETQEDVTETEQIVEQEPVIEEQSPMQAQIKSYSKYEDFDDFKAEDATVEEQAPVPVDDTVYADDEGNRYYLYTDGQYRRIN